MSGHAVLRKEADLSADPTVRRYASHDHEAVRSLFIRVNRALAPSTMVEAFEAYILRSLAEEIDHVERYFAERGGAFFVAEGDDGIVGMFGLEMVGTGTAELRRMYVDPAARGLGLGRLLLARSEDAARELGASRMLLSTSEIQQAALGLYRSAGFIETGQEIPTRVSNKQLGGGLRRFHFEKPL